MSENSNFADWATRWMVLARYDGAYVPDVARRIEQLVSLWQQEIPEPWHRGEDRQLLEQRYRRGDLEAPHPGEHAIEHDILCRYFDEISCYRHKLIDGVNAVPLARDAGGGRRANVEADMFLLAEHGGAYRGFLCEVKFEANEAWYAAVEGLRQLKLLTSSPEPRGLFARRNPSSCLPSDIPVTSLVLAPRSFYESNGKKKNARQPALQLLARFASEFVVDVRLAEWDLGLLKIG